MKKIIIGLFLFTFTFLVYDAESASVTSPYDSWMTVGYGFSFTDGPKYPSLGPINLSLGTSFLKFLAFEFNVSYINYTPNERTTRSVLRYNDDGAHTVLLKPYLLIRPDIPLGPIFLIPYAGVGVVANVSGVPSSNGKYSINFDGGFGAKAGIGLSYKRFLFNIETEYLWTSNNTPFSRDFSLGANIGFRY